MNRINKASNVFRTLNNVWKSSQYSKQSFRRIRRNFWPNKISNEDLLRQCNQDSMATILIRRRWKWIGRVIRRDEHSITRTARHWTPEGKRKCGRPKNTWRRTVEGEQQKRWPKTDRNGGPLLLPYMPMTFRAVSKYDTLELCFTWSINIVFDIQENNLLLCKHTTSLSLLFNQLYFHRNIAILHAT